MFGKRGAIAGLAMGLLAGGCGPVSEAPPASTTAPPTPVQTQVSAAPEPTAASTARADVIVLALGDSIPFNSPDDCPGCTSFVDQYGEALAEATGKAVSVINMSEHTGLTVEGLLTSFQQNASRMPAIEDADVIIVGIAHNDVPMNRDDDACDGAGGEEPDWSKFTDACIEAEMERFRGKYEAVFGTLAAAQDGQATVLRTINRYNDWIGWPEHTPPAAGVEATARVIAKWNGMLCEVGERHGFLCADISTAFNGKDGTKPSGDLLAGDHTHPSQKGNDVIAKVLIDLGFAPLV